MTSLSCGSISDISKESVPAKKLSASEPTTPHVAVDANRSINGDCSRTKDTQGLVSSDFETDREGFQSPDFLGQDTDDNISHDSYNVLEKEQPKTNPESMLTNNDRVVDNKSPEVEVLTSLLTNGTKECVGKFEETLEERKNSLPLDNESVAIEDNQIEDEEGKNKSHRHRVRVFSNHVSVGQTSPTLYARANRHLTADTETTVKAYPRTVDFVLVNQLPPIGSFSYKDDSVELKSPNKIKLEMFEQKTKSENPTVCNNIQKPKPHPTGVDLLNDIIPLKVLNSRRESLDKESINQLRKESALRVIADNLSSSTAQPSTSRDIMSVDLLGAANLPPRSQTHITTIAEMHSNTSDTPADISKELAYHNFYQMVYLDMCRDEDVVDYSSHYNYNSYKFSQVGRPSNAASSKTNNWYKKDAQSDYQS